MHQSFPRSETLDQVLATWKRPVNLYALPPIDDFGCACETAQVMGETACTCHERVVAAEAAAGGYVDDETDRKDEGRAFAQSRLTTPLDQPGLGYQGTSGFVFSQPPLDQPWLESPAAQDQSDDGTERKDEGRWPPVHIECTPGGGEVDVPTGAADGNIYDGTEPRAVA